MDSLRGVQASFIQGTYFRTFTVSHLTSGFQPEFEKWLSKMCLRACSNEQFVRQHKKNKSIFFTKWLSTGCLDTQLAQSLSNIV